MRFADHKRRLPIANSNGQPLLRAQGPPSLQEGVYQLPPVAVDADVVPNDLASAATLHGRLDNEQA